MEDKEKRLITLVADNYNLSVKSIKKSAQGAASEVYFLTLDNGVILVAKIQSTPSVGTSVSAWLTNSGFKYSPSIISSNKGSHILETGIGYLSLQEYVQNIGEREYDAVASDAEIHQLGKILKSLHALGTNHLPSELPIESFTPRFFGGAESELQAFRTTSHSSKYYSELLTLIEIKDREISYVFRKSIEQGEELKSSSPKLVLTHGDVHFANILTDTISKPYLIDWDNSMLAMPGLDLMFFDDETINKISIGYGEDLLARTSEISYYRKLLVIRGIWFYLDGARKQISGGEEPTLYENLFNILNDSLHFKNALK
jgi:Phosphotransferase enzyme family